MAIAETRPDPGPSRLATRLVVAALVGLTAALVFANQLYRTAEMALASGIVGVFTSSGVYLAAERQSLYFGLGTDHPFGLRMSPECTSAFLVLPLILVGAVMIWLRPAITKRVLVALGVAVVAVVLVNQLRILTLVGLVDWMGTDRGYYWGHTLLGSVVSVLGGAAALILFVRLATRKPAERAVAR